MRRRWSDWVVPAVVAALVLLLVAMSLFPAR